MSDTADIETSIRTSPPPVINDSNPSDFDPNKTRPISFLPKEYFADNSSNIKAGLIKEKDPIMLSLANQLVTKVYNAKENGYITEKQPRITIPNDLHAEDLFDPKQNQEITEKLILEQLGPKGLEKYRKGYVFVGVRPQSDEPIYLLDIHIPLQRTYIATLNGRILYTVRVIQRNGIPLPIQSLIEGGVIPIEEEYRDTAESIKVELSQLAGAVPTHEERDKMEHGFDLLFGAMLAEEDRRDNDEFLALLDERAYNSLNNVKKREGRKSYGLRAMNGKLPIREYMGSPVVPVFIDRDVCISTVALTDTRAAEILRSGIDQK